MANTLFKKIGAVMAEIGVIAKTGTNEHHKYKYMRYADLTENLQPLLVKHGLIIMPDCKVIERFDVQTRNSRGEASTKNITRVTMAFTVADTETGETVERAWFGEGYDDMDKGVYKAYTGAFKTFCEKLFCIASDDDPENDDPRSDTQTAMGKSEPKPAIKPPTPKVEQPAGQFVGGSANAGVSPPKAAPSLPTPPAQPAQTAQDGARRQNPDSKITDGQAKRLYAIARGAGWQDAEIKHYIQSKGYGSSKDILVRDYDAMVDYLQSGGGQPPPSGGE